MAKLQAEIPANGSAILTIDEQGFYALTVDFLSQASAGFGGHNKRYFPKAIIHWEKMEHGEWKPVLDDDGQPLIAGADNSIPFVTLLLPGDHLRATVTSGFRETIVLAKPLGTGYIHHVPKGD